MDASEFSAQADDSAQPPYALWNKDLNVATWTNSTHLTHTHTHYAHYTHHTDTKLHIHHTHLQTTHLCKTHHIMHMPCTSAPHTHHVCFTPHATCIYPTHSYTPHTQSTHTNTKHTPRAHLHHPPRTHITYDSHNIHHTHTTQIHKCSHGSPLASRGLTEMRMREGQAGTFMAVQKLRLHTSTAEGMGSIPGQKTKILHTSP